MAHQPDAGTSEVDKALFELHNKVRADPNFIVPELEKMLGMFDKDIYLKREGRSTIQTKDGVQGVKEAIHFLKTAEPVGPLSWKTGLASATKDHVDDIGPKGMTSHGHSTDGAINTK